MESCLDRVAKPDLLREEEASFCPKLHAFPLVYAADPSAIAMEDGGVDEGRGRRREEECPQVGMATRRPC